MCGNHAVIDGGQHTACVGALMTALSCFSTSSTCLQRVLSHRYLSGPRSSLLAAQLRPLPLLAMAPGLCVVCLNPGDCKRCACGAGWYCSRACQKHDWSFSEEPHREVCPLQALKDICNSYNVPSRVREVILSFTTKSAVRGHP